MRFKILELNGKFRSQRKTLFSWKDINTVPFNPVPGASKPMQYDSESEAIDSIKYYVTRNLIEYKEKKPKTWEQL